MIKEWEFMIKEWEFMMKIFGQGVGVYHERAGAYNEEREYMRKSGGLCTKAVCRVGFPD